MVHENVYLVLIMNLFFCFLSLSELTNLYGKALVAQRLKRLPPMWETQVRSLGREDPLEKEMVTHSSILAWRIHGWRRLVGYSPWGRKESDTAKHTRRHA